jgi:FkbM family methyltransferase
MQTTYNDYSRDLFLNLRHKLTHIREIPLKGSGRIASLLDKIIPVPKPKGPCLVKTLYGFIILVNPVSDTGVERSIFFKGTYENGTMKIMTDVLNKGRAFIDIGANIGLMSLHASRIMGNRGKVLSFEPLLSTYNILLQNISLNKASNIEAINIAVGSTNGIVEIFDNSKIRGASSLINTNQTQSSHRVPLKSLDTYLDEDPIESITCLKIDVEGWELEVLKGAAKTLSGSDAPICIIECSLLHPTFGGDIQDIYNLLCAINDYRIFRLERGKEEPSKLIQIRSKDNLPTHDNLFCFLPGHISRLPKRIFRNPFEIKINNG